MQRLYKYDFKGQSHIAPGFRPAETGPEASAGRKGRWWVTNIGKKIIGDGGEKETILKEKTVTINESYE